MKKILALLLCVLMLLSTLALVACGGDTPKETKDTGNKDSGDTTGSGDNTGDTTETKASKYLDDLPETADFGETIHFATTGGDYVIDGYKDGDGEFQSTDPVQKAVFQRWTEIEQRFNVEFDGQYGLGNSSVGQLIPADYDAGSNDFDIIEGHMKFNSGLAVSAKRYVANLQKVPNLDLTKDYWNPNYTNYFTYKKTTFWLTGDITTAYLAQLVGMYVNNKIWRETFADYDDPEFLMGDLFQLVDDGEWTLEEVRVRSQAAFSNADGELGTEDDTLGWVTGSGWFQAAVMSAAGYNYSVKDGKNKYKLDLCSPENEVVFSEFKKAFSDNASAFMASQIPHASDHDALFLAGDSLLLHERLGHMGGFRAMEDPGFSVVPMPKLNKESGYRTPSYDGIGIVSVTNSTKFGSEEHLNAVGTVFEALAAAGKKYLTPAYYEVGMKAKSTKNEGSYHCLDIIRQTGYSDFAFCWCGPLGEPDVFLSNNWKEASLATLSGQQAKYESLLDDMYYTWDSDAYKD